MADNQRPVSLDTAIEKMSKNRKSLGPAWEIEFASRIIQNAAHSLAGDYENASVARLILLSHELESMSKRIGEYADELAQGGAKKCVY